MAKRSTKVYRSAQEAYQAGYDWVYSLLNYTDASVMLPTVEAAYERSKANTLVPFISDYWRGQLDHLRERVNAVKA